MYTTDKYGMVINGEDTFAQAVADLKADGTVVVDWGDQDGTMFNILLSYKPARYGCGGGMVDGSGDKLWVGIAGKGCFAFTVGTDIIAPDYIGKKFKLGGVDVTTKALSVLLTEIRKGLSA